MSGLLVMSILPDLFPNKLSDRVDAHPIDAILFSIAGTEVSIAAAEAVVLPYYLRISN